MLANPTGLTTVQWQRKLRTGLQSLIVVLLSVILGACGSSTAAAKPQNTGSANQPKTTSSTSSTTSTTTTQVLPKYAHDHVFVIVMENLGFSAAMATTSLATLANRWAYSTNYYATTHPSLPNYISLVAGSTLGISSDCVTCYVNAPSLMSEMTQNGVSWDAFMESLPNDCYLSPYAPDGLYAGKHDPFVYFDAIRSSSSQCNNIKPLHELIPLLGQNPSTVPNFTWITPNLCNDGHNCSSVVAGNWLTQMVSQITSSAAWKDNGALYVTWDEGNGGDYSGLTASGQVIQSGGGGHVLTLVIEPNLRAGTTITAPLDHYGLLKTIEVNFHLSLLGESANSNLTTLP